MAITLISIHAPAKGATMYPAEASDQQRISIHAPAKGATLLATSGRNVPSISIHAPAKGATGLVICVLAIVLYFNPRSREGSDHQSSGQG